MKSATEFYSYLYSILQGETGVVADIRLTVNPDDSSESLFLLNSISYVIKKLKRSKALKPDGIDNEMLKESTEGIIPRLMKLVNKILTGG